MNKRCCSLDILLELREVNGRLQGHLSGKETFFSVQTFERMVKHFQVICKLKAKDIVMLEAPTKNKLLNPRKLVFLE